MAALGMAMTVGAGPVEGVEEARDAIVKIAIVARGATVAEGMGFFTTKDGELATNLHVMAAALHGAEARFELADGRKVTGYEVAGCGGIDLCVLRLAVKPKAWIPAAANKPEIGGKVSVVGRDGAADEGTVSDYRKGPGGTGLVQITATVGPMNSGGPILDEDGKLVGMAAWSKAEQRNLGIQAGTVALYRRDHLDFSGAAEFAKTFAQERKEEARAQKTAELEPMIELVRKDRSKLGLAEGEDVYSAGDGVKFLSYLPRRFSTCAAKTPIACADATDDGEFSFDTLAAMPAGVKCSGDVCRSRVPDPETPNAYTYAVLVQRPGRVDRAQIWIREPYYAAYYEAIPGLFLDAMRPATPELVGKHLEEVRARIEAGKL